MTKVRLILLIGYATFVVFAGCRSAHTTSAILYIEEQQYDKAIEVLHESFEYQDDEPGAFYYLGEAHSRIADVAVNDNDYNKAKENFELAYSNFMRAKELDSENFTEEVDIALQDNYNRRLRQGGDDFTGKFYHQAEGHWRLAYAALPDSTTPIKNIATMKMQMAREVELDGGDPEPLLNEALELIERVLAIRPELYTLQANKADVLVQLGRTSEADQLYRQLLKEHGDDPYLLIDIVNLAVSQLQFERAADLTLQVIDIYKNDQEPGNDGEQTKLLMVRAATWLALDEIRRYDESLELLDQALDLETFPTEATLTQRLQTYYSYGQYLKAQAGEEADPATKAQLEQLSKEQFSLGIDVGNALVGQYPSACMGYLFLGQCQYETDDNQASELNIKNYTDCQGEIQ